MDDFYVYMYLDSAGVPFYIGKGRNKRYLPSRHMGYNCFLKRKILKIGLSNIRVHLLSMNLSESEALFWERYWIKYIGRRNHGLGTLCNLTDGGDGTTGWDMPQSTRDKISKARTGKIRWAERKLGVIRSE